MTSGSPTHTPVSNPPTGFPRVVAHLIYDDVGAAVDWLCATFGFRERAMARHSTQERVSRTQIEIVDSVIKVGEPSVHGDSPRRGVSSMLLVYVDDVDDHYERSRAAGAEIVQDLETLPWGDRRYQVTDPEGHHWNFAQHVADVELDEEHLHPATG